ncbi:hypothetical protein BGW38_000468 [Lunasporangiospora selenospora]|uniref:Yeast cell wall synthesis Kre9/Knh1-like N-terminal domain-containing protein n=1 Tax=Lunasporangiospora selenospora TaxID=979761 RepID=A0A9P6KE66_9FUNG|nr:hypothetical protein BGW38_000468 [Lunasporangiospora selenospora]
MKFIATLAAASAAVALTSAQIIQINNPTKGTNWKIGSTVFISWTANCKSMGAAAQSVKIDLVNGPSDAVQFVEDLGFLNCSGDATRSNITVPAVTPGEYSVRVMTTPTNSYSPAFNVISDGSKPSEGTNPTTQPPTPTPSGKSAANSLVASTAVLALGGAALAALQLVL